jgi:hypothetical protein
MNQKNYVRVGEPIPIQAQLHDGAENRQVYVRILDPISKEIGRHELVAGVAGFYFTNLVNMPAQEFITVQAHVIGEDDLGQPYAVVSERFYSAPKEVPAPAPEKFLKGQLVFSRDVSPFLKGYLK